MKIRKKVFMLVLILLILANVQSSENRKGIHIPILMYHEVSDETWGKLDYLFISPDTMKEQLLWLKSNNYNTIFFSDIPYLTDYDNPVILTFDDGYEGNYTYLFPLLKELDMKATIFVPTDFIGQQNRLTAEQIKEMSDSGLVSIQSHTKSHTRIDELNAVQLEEEFQQSKDTIYSITGRTPCVISYPEGKFSRISNSIVPRYFLYGTINQKGPWRIGRQDRFHLPRTVIPRNLTLKQFADRISQ